METLSKAEFARRLHVSKPRVSQLIQKGMPITEEGRVDVAEALNWIEGHIDLSHKDSVASRQAAPAPVAPPPPEPPAPAAPLREQHPEPHAPTGRQPSQERIPHPAESALPAAGVMPPDPGKILLTAKARRAIVDLRRAERLERLETGELVEVAEIQGKIDAMIHNAKSKLMGLGHVLAPRVAIETDVAKCQDLIDEGVREALTGLAGYQPA